MAHINPNNENIARLPDGLFCKTCGRSADLSNVPDVKLAYNLIDDMKFDEAQVVVDRLYKKWGTLNTDLTRLDSFLYFEKDWSPLDRIASAAGNPSVGGPEDRDFLRDLAKRIQLGEAAVEDDVNKLRELADRLADQFKHEE